MMDEKVLTDFLGHVDLFMSLSSDFREKIAQKLQYKSFNKGTLIYCQGDPGDTFYLIKSGAVELYRKELTSGIDFVISTLKEYDCFGELSLLTGEAHITSARAISDTEVYFLSRKIFLQIIQKLPEVGVSLSTALAKRLVNLTYEKGIPFIKLAKYQCDPEIFLTIPKKIMTQHKVVPIKKSGNVLTVAMVNPYDITAIDSVVRSVKNLRIEPVAVELEDFNKFFNKSVLPVIENPEAILSGSGEKSTFLKSAKKEYNIKFIEENIELVTPEEQGKQIAGEQIVSLVNQILGEALEYDASDIHIEPQADECIIRYRIDGKLWKRPETLQMRFHPPLVARLKVLGRMNITEKRKPQDGRISTFRNNREIDFRVSTLPTRFGEKVVLRVLDRSSFLVSLNRLIVSDRVYELVKSMVEQPYGIILITGPTGSGKTTTMYSALLERKDEGINIVTVEDPIEYTIPGINQVQVSEASGIDFSEAIRAFLRQDPDIILVGETRDSRTAKTSMAAALMGHLVFTSLHTNDALGTIYRLRDMQIEPFLIANSVVGVIYQRLVRRICQSCRVRHNYDKALIERIRVVSDSDDETIAYYIGKGCPACNNTGFRGRIAAYEVLKINEELRHLISIDAPMANIKEAALKAGMITLKSYCHTLLTMGLTTPQDVIRILYSEED